MKDQNSQWKNQIFINIYNTGRYEIVNIFTKW